MVSMMTLKGRNDGLFWLMALIFWSGTVATSVFLVQYPLPWRIMAGIAFFVIGAYASTRTQKGAAFVRFWQASLLEVRKAVWPTRQETMQMTIAVLLMVFVMGVVLWGVDLLLLKIVATLTGRWGN